MKIGSNTEILFIGITYGRIWPEQRKQWLGWEFPGNSGPGKAITFSV
jgi:hypothetical protein